MAKELQVHYWNRVMNGSGSAQDTKINYIRIDRFWEIVSYEKIGNEPLVDMVVWQFNDMDDFYHYIKIDKESYDRFMSNFGSYPAYLKMLYFQSFMSTSHNTYIKDSLDLATDDTHVTIDTTFTGKPLYIDDFEIESKLICRRCSGIKEEERSITKLFKKLDEYFKEAK